MSLHPEFAKATPQDVVSTLDDRSIHLWRLPYAPSQRRAPLLALLAAYLGIPASEVALDHNAKGKPQLQATPSFSGKARQGGPDQTLSFNWSHSGDYALVALSRCDAVGVDIERLGKNLRALEIARRFFERGEADALAMLDAEARNHAFIGLWCAKEAVLKAVGEGLSFGLDRLAFAHVGGADWQLTRTDAALGDLHAWQVAGFNPAPVYRGALAWRGDVRNILAFQPASDRVI